jgi:inner membrane protein
MDNLTHSLVGLVAAKAGLEKWSPGATAVAILAANAPDSDIVVLLTRDRWSFLQHHRGITHSIIGTLILAIALPLTFYLGDYLLSLVGKGPQKVKLGWLLAVSLIVGATHPLLDWTNNYGIRFFLPWSQQWSYGDLVFIVDPFLWLTFGGAAFLLTSGSRVQKWFWLAIGVVSTFVIIVGPRFATSTFIALRLIWALGLVILITLFVLKAGKRFGARLALAAFGVAILYWGSLWFIHQKALKLAETQAQTMIQSDRESIMKIAAMPTLANPLRWDCVFETNLATYRFPLSLIDAQVEQRVVRYPKPDTILGKAINGISNDRRLGIFEGFARFPVSQLADPGCVTKTLVEFADLRYTEPGNSRGTFSLELPVDCPVSSTHQ